MTDLNLIAEAFAEYFRNWQIALPSKNLELRQPGNIQSEGWYIQFLFGTEGGLGFFDFYARHRMTNDLHVRIFASGESVHLPALADILFFPADATDEQKQAIQQRFDGDNERIAEDLRRKGFSQ